MDPIPQRSPAGLDSLEAHFGFQRGYPPLSRSSCLSSIPGQILFFVWPRAGFDFFMRSPVSSRVADSDTYSHGFPYSLSYNNSERWSVSPHTCVQTMPPQCNDDLRTDDAAQCNDPLRTYTTEIISFWFLQHLPHMFFGVISLRRKRKQCFP